MSVETQRSKLYSVQGGLAALSAAACLIVTAGVWAVVAQQQSIWPLPAVDLLEVALLTLGGAWGLFQGGDGASLLAWAAIGALLSFSVVDGSSVGLYYLPVMALLAGAAVWRDRSRWHQLPLHLCLALISAWAQATLMLVLVRWLTPGAIL